MTTHTGHFTAAYTLAMPFENGAMVQKLQAWTKGENNLCQAIGQHLLKDEANVVLNAAGAVASLVTFTHPEMYHTDLVFRDESLYL